MTQILMCKHPWTAKFPVQLSHACANENSANHQVVASFAKGHELGAWSEWKTWWPKTQHDTYDLQAGWKEVSKPYLADRKWHAMPFEAKASVTAAIVQTKRPRWRVKWFWTCTKTSWYRGQPAISANGERQTLLLANGSQVEGKQ